PCDPVLNSRFIPLQRTCIKPIDSGCPARGIRSRWFLASHFCGLSIQLFLIHAAMMLDSSSSLSCAIWRLARIVIQARLEAALRFGSTAEHLAPVAEAFFVLRSKISDLLRTTSTTLVADLVTP